MKKYKKKSNGWKLFFAVFFLFGGLGNIGKDAAAALFGIVVGVLCGVWWWTSRGGKETKSGNQSAARERIIWDEQVHFSKGQSDRMKRAILQDMEIVSTGENGAFMIRSSDEGKTYKTTPAQCTCEDFKFRKIPCKHIYYLLIQRYGFDSDKYISYGDNTNVSVKKYQGNIEKVRDYYAIDTETTGFSAIHDKIIEISILKIHDGAVVDEFNSLVSPDMPIPDAASATNHIVDSDVADAPHYKEVAESVARFLPSCIIIGHNVQFDLSFLSAMLYGINTFMDLQYIDTLDLARKKLPDLPNHKLQTVIAHLGITTDNAHRAHDDVKATVEVFERLRGQ